MKRLITQPSESNEATQAPEPAPVEHSESATKRSYVSDTEKEPITPQELAERYRRLRGHRAKGADLGVFTDQDAAVFLGVGAIAESNPEITQHDTDAGVKETLPTRKEVRARERAELKNIPKPLGKRALDAAVDVVKVGREKVDAIVHRDTQLVKTNYGDVRVKINYTRKPTQYISR